MTAATAASEAPESTARRLVAVGAFPIVLSAAVVAAHYAYLAGYAEAAAGAAVFVPALIVAVLERYFPYHESWLHSNGDLRVDLLYAPLITFTSVVVGPAAGALGFILAAWASTQFGSGLWPSHWHLAAQIPLALAIAEFPKYWHHRWQHETDFLWRFHATHHSVPRLYFLNATRFHPIDIYIDGVLGLLPLVALGAGVEILLMFSVISAVHGFFQHANIPVRIGPLNYIFSMAELHRWHHSKTVAEANHNYGQNVILWDLVFGTFYLPSDREPPEKIGLADLAAFPMDLLGQLASPFTWGSIHRRSDAAREAASESVGSAGASSDGGSSARPHTFGPQTSSEV